MVKVNVIWPHGQEIQDDFMLHLNSIHTNIQFTMDTEGQEEMATVPSWKKET
jgi:hypothetical protein